MCLSVDVLEWGQGLVHVDASCVLSYWLGSETFFLQIVHGMSFVSQWPQAICSNCLNVHLHPGKLHDILLFVVHLAVIVHRHFESKGFAALWTFMSGFVSSMVIFRWFKFTLKPPYTITHGNLLLAIWDTSHWTSFVKFELKTAWDISYDILWPILKYVNFWWLQGCSSNLPKKDAFRK